MEFDKVDTWANAFVSTGSGSVAGSIFKAWSRFHETVLAGLYKQI
jgi:hypothetical protein